MIPDPTPTGNTRADDIRDAAWNATAVASIHYQQSLNALRSILTSAHSHGLTVDDLVTASGFDRDRVVALILEDA